MGGITDPYEGVLSENNSAFVGSDGFLLKGDNVNNNSFIKSNILQGITMEGTLGNFQGIVTGTGETIVENANPPSQSLKGDPLQEDYIKQGVNNLSDDISGSGGISF